MTEPPEAAPRRRRKGWKRLVLVLILVVALGALWRHNQAAHESNCHTSGNIISGERDCLVGP